MKLFLKHIFYSIVCFVAYKISDLMFLILNYAIPYRKKIITKNLKNAFPELNDKKIRSEVKLFYRNFADWLVENFLLYFFPEKSLDKTIEIDKTEYEKFSNLESNFYGLLGHQFNWEYVNLYTSYKKIFNNLYVFYLPLQNKKIDKSMFKMRSRFGSKMVSAYEFGRKMLQLKNQKHCMGMIADQRPFQGENAYWCDFLNQKTPFIKEAEKGAILFNAKVFFVKISKKKRGVYKLDFEEIIYDPSKKGDLTLQYVKKLEKAIKEVPHNYLWTHNRWKFKFDESKNYYIK